MATDPAGFQFPRIGRLSRAMPTNVRRLVMEQTDIPPATPKDATEATQEQRELQEKLEHQNDDDDPNTPGQHQTRHQIADET